MTFATRACFAMLLAAPLGLPAQVATDVRMPGVKGAPPSPKMPAAQTAPQTTAPAATASPQAIAPATPAATYAPANPTPSSPAPSVAQNDPQPMPSTVVSAPTGPIAAASPATGVYTINPGDAIDLNFRWTPEFNQTVIVQPDGNANINAIGGPMRVAGLTVQQLHDQLIERTANRLINPEITIALHDVDRPHVLIGGEVTTPGRIDLRHATTAFEAIFLAGGPKESSAMSHAVLFRRVDAEYSEVIHLNYAHYDGGKAPKEDVMLRPGDVIVVPRDALTKIGRYVKTLNIGAYLNFNPLNSNGVF